MPYDEEVEQRIRVVINQWPHTAAKKMFGGVCYLLSGNMVAGVYEDQLILRLGEESAREALKKDHVGPFDITGRPMRGWVMVASAGFRRPTQLNQWLDLAREFVSALPAK